jgi:hypothetical protein
VSSKDRASLLVANMGLDIGRREEFVGGGEGGAAQLVIIVSCSNMPTGLDVWQDEGAWWRQQWQSLSACHHRRPPQRDNIGWDLSVGRISVVAARD